jgi:hypothetical protein
MTGGIVPKLNAVRWPAGIFVVLLLVAGISFAPAALRSPGRGAGSAGSTAPGDYAGERQELLFFKAALGRIDDELRHRGAAATPSLRGEREAVLRRMREVASRVPPERLPPEIPALLELAPAATAAVGTPPRSGQPAPKIDVRELQTGLGTPQDGIDFSSLALDPLPPLPIYIERPARRAVHARDAEPAGDKTAERPARERPAKDKERVAAQKPAREQPPAKRAVAERPPVTVERTAVAGHAERPQPAR